MDACSQNNDDGGVNRQRLERRGLVRGGELSELSGEASVALTQRIRFDRVSRILVFPRLYSGQRPVLAKKCQPAPIRVRRSRQSSTAASGLP